MSEQELALRYQQIQSERFIVGLREYAQMHTNRTCDKCGGHVPSNNSTALWRYIDTVGILDYDFDMPSHDRHITPVIGEDGVQVCEGSPSRAQYIPGGIPDTRSEFQIKYPQDYTTGEVI